MTMTSEGVFEQSAYTVRFEGASKDSLPDRRTFNSNPFCFMATAGYHATLVLRIVGVSRTTYYYQQSHEPQPHTTAGGRPIPGYSLTKEQCKISDEQIKEWIMEALAGEDRFFFILSYIDVYDRQIVGYHIGKTCEVRHAVETLRAAICSRRNASDGRPRMNEFRPERRI